MHHAPIARKNYDRRPSSVALTAGANGTGFDIFTMHIDRITVRICASGVLAHSGKPPGYGHRQSAVNV